MNPKTESLDSQDFMRMAEILNTWADVEPDRKEVLRMTKAVTGHLQALQGQTHQTDIWGSLYCSGFPAFSMHGAYPNNDGRAHDRGL